MKVVQSFLIGLVLACSGNGQTPAPQPDRVHDFVQGEMQRQHIPGLSLFVARDGKVLLAKARGRGVSHIAWIVPSAQRRFKLNCCKQAITLTENRPDFRSTVKTRYCDFATVGQMR